MSQLSYNISISYITPSDFEKFINHRLCIIFVFTTYVLFLIKVFMFKKKPSE